MTDTISRERRSKNMQAIRSRNMQPEMQVRRLVHGMGYRFRLHKSDLPGKPDLVFSRLRKVVFVHGCFWHQHDCHLGKLPKSNQAYWFPKLRRNQERDDIAQTILNEMGWRVVTIWECEAVDRLSVRELVSSRLENTPRRERELLNQ